MTNLVIYSPRKDLEGQVGIPVRNLSNNTIRVHIDGKPYNKIPVYFIIFEPVKK